MSAGNTYLRYALIILALLWFCWVFFPVWDVAGQEVKLWHLVGLWEPKRAYNDPYFFAPLVFQSLISLVAAISFACMVGITVFRMVLAYRDPVRLNFIYLAGSFVYLAVSVVGVLFSRAFMLSGQLGWIQIRPGFFFPLGYAAIAFLFTFFAPRENTKPDHDRTGL